LGLVAEGDKRNLLEARSRSACSLWLFAVWDQMPSRLS
jgi:hypothetical protein